MGGPQHSGVPVGSHKIVRPFDKSVELAMFDWNDLRDLLAIAREGSTLAAAKALGVSQPTVQRRLTALRERIDRKLSSITRRAIA